MKKPADRKQGTTVRVRVSRPGFLREALERIQKRVPEMLAKAIREAQEPAGFTFAKYGDQSYLLFDRALTPRDRREILRLWPLYLSEHGEPPHLSRLVVRQHDLEILPPEDE